MRRRWLAGCVLLTMATGAASQTMSFDVASVKVNKSGENRVGFSTPPGGMNITNLPLRSLITQAFRLNDYELLNLPGWADTTRYDVVAKAHAGASGEDRLLMLRTLVVDRFKLKMHTESREMALYTLTFARDDQRLGANITPSAIDCEARSRQPAPTPPPPAPGQGPPAMECGVSMGMTPAGAFLNAGGMQFRDLVRLISSNLGRPVVDKTGLTGSYNVKMQYQTTRPGLPGLPLPQTPAGSSAESTLPSLMTAVTEQLGLKLESGRGAVPIQVVDSVERPTED